MNKIPRSISKKYSLGLIHLGIVLGLILYSGMGCNQALKEAGSDANNTKDPTFAPFHIASQKDTPEAYRNFLGGYRDSIFADKAKRRLAELLIQKRDKNALIQYAVAYPKYKSLVEGVLNEMVMLEKARQHLLPGRSDTGLITLRPGESFYGHLYFKAYVGRDESANAREYTYKISLGHYVAPDYIKVEVLQDLSFTMEESLNAMVNIFYKVTVAPNAPTGTSEISVMFGLDRVFSPEEEIRKESGGISHKIEIVEHSFDSAEDVDVDYVGAKLLAEKEGETAAKLKSLAKPKVDAFGTRYVYALSQSSYQVEQMEYRLGQLTALRHLETASRQLDPAIRGKAEEYLDDLKEKGLTTESLAQNLTEKTGGASVNP